MSVTASQLLAEIVEMTAPPVARPGDFTLPQYREAIAEQRGYSISETTARRWLDEAIEAGELEKETVLLDGRTRIAYRKVRGGDDERL